jgi:L-lactate oxidase
MTLMRRDFLLSGTLAAAAMTAGGPTLAQNTIPTPSAPGVPQPRANVPYEASKEAKKLNIFSLFDLEDAAKKVLPEDGFDYIASGSGLNLTRSDNVLAFDRIHIEPQPLSGRPNVDLATEILKSKLTLPIIVPPMSGHGLAHVLKEEGTAKAAHAAGTLMITSTKSDLSLEEIAAFNPGPKWFQFDFPHDLGYARELLERAKAAGYTAIVPTVDDLFAYPREDSLRSEFQPPAALGKGNRSRNAASPEQADSMSRRKTDLGWEDMEWVKEISALPVIIKGVMSPKAAAMAVKREMDAVYVSNHGGRSLDGVVASIAALPRIADAVQDSVPIIFDGGIRRGADVFKALALGATVVACGRPMLYGLALGGTEGAYSVLEYLRTSLTLVMRLAGTRTLQDIKPEYLAPE